MKVYKPGCTGIHRLYVQPGSKYPDKSEWMTKTGTKDDSGKDVKTPTMFTIEFVDGVAKVDSQLGKYLLDEGLAERSPIIIPAVELATA